jgi:hypothetical protein
MKRAATFDGCFSWLIAYSPSKTTGALASDLLGSSKFTLKRHAESRAEKADANKFQQRLTCRGPASLQFWGHDLASTALCATGKQTFR